MANIQLLHYKNYINRQLKFYESAAEYEPYLLQIVPNYDFNPNDGITTSIVIDDMTEIPDYLLVTTDVGNEIESRWYVMEAKRNVYQQYQLSLFRDCLADYFDSIANAPMFVEKGPLPANSPLLFNQEDMTFNQIRQQPTILNDITKVPWIVGYIPKDADLDNKTINATYNIKATADITVETLADWDYYHYISNPAYIKENYYTTFRYILCPSPSRGGFWAQNHTLSATSAGETMSSLQSYATKTGEKPEDGADGGDAKFTNTYYYYVTDADPNAESKNKPVVNAFKAACQDSQYNTYLNGYMVENYNVANDTEIEELMTLNDKLIKVTEADQMYKINIIQEPVELETSLKDQRAMINALNSKILTPNGGSVQQYTYSALFKGYKLNISLTQVQGSLTATLSNDRYHLEDEPYDMFCIPYGDIFLMEPNSGFRSQKTGIAIAQALAAELGKDAVYDIQILPYSPIQHAWDEEWHWVDLSLTKYSIIKDENERNISAIIWCRQSNFSFNLPLTIRDNPYAVEKKILSQTTVYRLTSPNGNGIFEFNPYKNGGVDYLRVDCSYKPFSPYIRLAPVFKGLYGYGGQYDYRGLILGGDFSITQLSNAWANYQLQNKNYQAMFDRQIESMEVQNKYQRIQEITGAVMGSGQAAMSGAMTGAFAGGSTGSPYGAIAGAVIGGVAGVAAGFADVAISQKLRQETLDYTKDQFGYQLGNIQALPTSIAKTSANNINNPLIPMLEIFTCTDKEKEAFRNKLLYNGFTVMAIGTMNDHLTTPAFGEGKDYFKGKLIRVEDLYEEAHMANIISTELNQGVYL